jgi:serine/threonine-protein kinase haspin
VEIAHFCEVTVLQGRPSELFAKAWKSWNKSRPRGKKSEFPDPTKRSSYEDTQLWVIIEMQDAGTDCEKMMEAGGVGTVWEIWDVFWGVCLSVAKAEEACRFEHRDLHLENICIRSARPGMDPMEPVIRNPLKKKFGFSGLETTVIDYTLSRADIVGSSKHESRRTSSSSNSSFVSALSTSTTATSPNDAEVAYLDLNKSVGLFDGNAEDEYQYEIYRYMRGAVFHNNPLWQAQDYNNERPSTPVEYTPETPRRSPRKAQTLETPGSASLRSISRPSTQKPTREPDEDIWKRFHPKTNLVWAHFILYKLLEHMEGYEPANLSLEDIMVRVKASPEDAPKVQKKAIRLFRVLEKVNQMLEPSELGKEDSLGSMKDLVVLAIEHRWLGVGDVAGEDVDAAY